VPDILYIHPAKHGVDTGFQDLGFFFFLPVGVIGLINALRQVGRSVRGVNYPAELLRDRSFRLKPWLAAQKDVHLVLVDLHWYMHSYGAVRVAQACKEVLPHARVVIGGITYSFTSPSTCLGKMIRPFARRWTWRSALGGSIRRTC